MIVFLVIKAKGMSLQQLLTTYKSSGLEKKQLELVDAFLELNNEEKAYSRENLKRHFTASAFVYDPSKKQCLLIKHKKLGFWMQPGGHADGDRDLFAVAKKELSEECSLEGLSSTGEVFDLDCHTIPEHKGVPSHDHYDVRFLFVADSQKLKPKANEELLDLSWIDSEQLEALNTDTSVKRMYRKASQL